MNDPTNGLDRRLTHVQRVVLYADLMKSLTRDQDRRRRGLLTVANRPISRLLWKRQDGKCYLCQRPFCDEEGVFRAPVHIDHDHRCCPRGRSCNVCRRGLACLYCNHVIGFAGDDPERLELIARNLRRAKSEVTARMVADRQSDLVS